MGCYYSKTSLHDKIENSYMIPFEKSLGFYLLDPNYLDTVLYQNSTFGYMNNSQISKVFSDFKLPFQPLIGFYEIFARAGILRGNERTFCTKKIATLCILLGKASNLEKSALLFRLYKYLNKVNRKSITEMVHEILKITLCIIPDFILSLNIHDKSLNAYVSYLKSSEDTIKSNLIEFLLSNTESLTYEEFSAKIKLNPCEKILSSQKLRKWALKLYIKYTVQIEKFSNNSKKPVLNIIKDSENSTQLHTNKKKNNKSVSIISDEPINEFMARSSLRSSSFIEKKKGKKKIRRTQSSRKYKNKIDTSSDKEEYYNDRIKPAKLSETYENSSKKFGKFLTVDEPNPYEKNTQSLKRSPKEKRSSDELDPERRFDVKIGDTSILQTPKRSTTVW
jgi:hypothetical protein